MFASFLSSNPELFMRTLFPILIFLSWAATSQAQCVDPSPEMRARLEEDLIYLSDDKLEGRLPGTEGERLASEYIAARFKSLNLKPAGDSGSYFQSFPFWSDGEVSGDAKLELSGKTLRLGEDFYPLPYASSADLSGKKIVDAGYGIEAPELERNDYAKLKCKGKVLLINCSSPDGVHPHSKFAKYNDLGERLALAAKKGAAAVLLYNEDPNLPDPSSRFRRLGGGPLPAVFLTASGKAALGNKAKLGLLRYQLREVRQQGRNVAAFLDHGAARTLVIGAHYDHLGYGDDGSRHRGEPAIHNGADDNASGTAALLELARYYANQDLYRNHNYLFVAFSAEEKGLIGSKYFADHSPIPLASLNYMLNMDMVGRLSESLSLAISGVGTSPAWPKALAAIQCYGMTTKTSESGVGPSDHTSFYLKDIPVLHFFTGTHSDYHLPSDDSDKINFEGLSLVTAYIASLINELDDEGKLAFSKTQDASDAPRPRFSVTMGIMPDYVFDGEGVKIDAVTEGRPASAAGIQAGDVLIQLGERKIRDVNSYMEALSQFKKGDQTRALLRRGSEEVQVEVVF
jgi:hypothetical protein